MKLPETEKELTALIIAAKAKLEQVRKDEARAKREAVEAAVKKAKRGMLALVVRPLPGVIWLQQGKRGPARRLDHSIQPGAILSVYAVQPRAKRIWIEDGKNRYAFDSMGGGMASLEFYPDELTANVARVTRMK